MKRIVIAALVVLLLASVCLAKDDAKKDKADWKEIVGIYMGKAEIYNQVDHMIPSDVQVQIRKSKEKDYYVIEIFYFGNQVAKFTKCERVTEGKLKIYDKVRSNNKDIEVTGKLSTFKGKEMRGEIKFKTDNQYGERVTFRTFKLQGLKKVTSK